MAIYSKLRSRRVVQARVPYYIVPQVPATILGLRTPPLNKIIRQTVSIKQKGLTCMLNILHGDVKFDSFQDQNPRQSPTSNSEQGDGSENLLSDSYAERLVAMWRLILSP